MGRVKKIKWEKRVPLTFKEARKKIIPIIDRLESKDYEQSKEWDKIKKDATYGHWSDETILRHCRRDDFKRSIINYASNRCLHIEDRAMLCFAAYGEIRFRYDEYAALIHEELYFKDALLPYEWLKVSEPTFDNLTRWYFEDFRPKEKTTIDTVTTAPIVDNYIIWQKSMTDLARWVAKLKSRGYFSYTLTNAQAARVFSRIFLIYNSTTGRPETINVDSFEQVIKECAGKGESRKINPEINQMDLEVEADK